MLKLQKNYRSAYKGEKIVVDRSYTSGVWQDTVEWVNNAVENNQISNKAVVIGNGTSRLWCELSDLKHYSGLLGAETLQTYGCNALYRDFTPDFLVASGSKSIIDEIATSGYTNDNIVYSNAIHLLEYPTTFYMIPHDPYADAGTTALYLAAFDGHKTIFMLGFDGHDAPEWNNNIYAGTKGYDPLKGSTILSNKWEQHQKIVFDTYDDVEFVRVTQHNTERLPELWNYCTNLRTISRNEFIIEAGL